MVYRSDNAVLPLCLLYSHSIEASAQYSSGIHEALEPTWPPGPELLENDSSTDPRVIDSLLNFAIHDLASFASAGVVRDVRGGGFGSVLVVDFAYQRARKAGLMCAGLRIERDE